MSSEIALMILMAAVCLGMLGEMYSGWRATPPIEAARVALVAPPGKRPDPPVPSQPFSLEGAAIKGNKGASVVMIEFSEFQCPYCATFAKNTLPQIEEHYVRTGKVQLAFRHFPLDTIHPHAMKAAESAECARRQGRFWEMHDLLFDDPKKLDPASLLERAARLGLNVRDFTTCLGGDVAASVGADRLAGQMADVSGTPTFFLGLLQPDGRVRVVERFSGAAPFARFQGALDRLLETSAGKP